MMNQENLENDDTRIRIVKVASELFSKHGFAGVSTRKIAEVARCNIASLSYHFGSKKKLYYECLWQMEPKDDERVKSILQRSLNQEDFHTKIKSFCKVFAEYVSANSSSLKLLIDEINADNKEPVKDAFLRPISERFENFLEEAQAEGIVNKDIEPGLLTTMVISVIVSQKMFKSIKPYEEITNEDLANRIVKSCTCSFYKA